MDQLDCDIESVILPLPVGRVGYAFSLKDELGYDFTNHPPGRFPFPREKLAGAESLVAYSIGSYPLNLGVSFRNFNYRFYRAISATRELPEDGATKAGAFQQERLAIADWLKQGQGYSVGTLLGIPSVRVSFTKSRFDVNTFNVRSGLSSEKTSKENRSGFRLFPLGFLTFAREARVISEIRRRAYRPEPVRSQTKEKHFSISVRPFGFIEIGIGNWNGSRTVGFRARILGLAFAYSELKDFFKRIVGNWGDIMQDLHFYGFQILLL